MKTATTPEISPTALLRQLIRFDTSNPPGNERACMEYIGGLLLNAGIETLFLAKSDDRPNLVARLPGGGQSPPFLMYGHADVVPVVGQDWSQPPFEGVLSEGTIWGRGTLDMKGGLAMMIAAMLRVKSSGFTPAGDILLAVVSDEEAGGDFGARFLVQEHPGLFHEIRYAISEFGGFTMQIAGKRFYPIQVAEKQPCWMRAILHGPGGHGAMPVQDGAMAGLGKLLTVLNRKRMPLHVTLPARSMISAMGSNLGGMSKILFYLFLQPLFSDLILNAMGEKGRLFRPLLHNTVSPTVLHGSQKINVIPSQVSVELDGRLLPGFGFDDMRRELQQICPPGVEFELLRYDGFPSEPDMGMFDLLADILKESDPSGIPIPFFLSAFTDARFFSRLGIQTYGFTPMQLPGDGNFSSSVHGVDENIPEKAVLFGTEAIHRLIQRYV